LSSNLFQINVSMPASLRRPSPWPPGLNTHHGPNTGRHSKVVTCMRAWVCYQTKNGCLAAWDRYGDRYGRASPRRGRRFSFLPPRLLTFFEPLQASSGPPSSVQPLVLFRCRQRLAQSISYCRGGRQKNRSCLGDRRRRERPAHATTPGIGVFFFCTRARASLRCQNFVDVGEKLTQPPASQSRCRGSPSTPSEAVRGRQLAADGWSPRCS